LAGKAKIAPAGETKAAHPGIDFLRESFHLASRRYNMPVATIKVIEGVFSADEKRRMIEKVTEAMASVEGEKLREKTYVIIEEIKSGEWAIGGKIITTDHVKHLQTSG
jgi:4-oxalocrotonate tautomerase